MFCFNTCVKRSHAIFTCVVLLSFLTKVTNIKKGTLTKMFSQWRRLVLENWNIGIRQDGVGGGVVKQCWFLKRLLSVCNFMSTHKIWYSWMTGLHIYLKKLLLPSRLIIWTNVGHHTTHSYLFFLSAADSCARRHACHTGTLFICNLATKVRLSYLLRDWCTHQ